MQVLLLLVLSVSLYFGAAFAGELIETQRTARQMASLRAEIDGLRIDNGRLKDQVSQAQTDSFVEREARDKLGMIRPDDVAVVITNAPSRAPVPTPGPTPIASTHWQKWAAAFRQ